MISAPEAEQFYHWDKRLEKCVFHLGHISQVDFLRVDLQNISPNIYYLIISYDAIQTQYKLS